MENLEEGEINALFSTDPIKSLTKQSSENPSNTIRSEKQKSSSSNIWGSVLFEETLTSELTNISVAQKSAELLSSDRGAESYDYSVAGSGTSSQAKTVNIKQQVTQAKLDADLDKYWNKRPNVENNKTYENSVVAGSMMPTHNKKVNIKHKVTQENLDADLDKYWNKQPTVENDEAMDIARQQTDSSFRTNKRKWDKRHKLEKTYLKDEKMLLDNASNATENSTITQTGVPRTIPDLSVDFTKNLLAYVPIIIDVQQVDSKTIKYSTNEMITSSTPSDIRATYYKNITLGNVLAKHLLEPKAKLMIGVIDLVGGQVVLELFQKTQKIESEGGMMIKNGGRRKTPGGVFLHLLREMTDDPRVDPKKVKQFFAQSQKNDFHKNHKKNERNSTLEQKGRAYQRNTNAHPYKKKYSSLDKRNHSSNDPEKNNFQNELEALRKLTQKVKKEQEKGNQAQ